MQLIFNVYFPEPIFHFSKFFCKFSYVLSKTSIIDQYLLDFIEYCL